MVKKTKTVKELEGEVNNLIEYVEKLKEQLNEVKSDIISRIDAIEKEVNAGSEKIKSKNKQMKKVSNTPKCVKCNLCESTFNKNVDLERHIKEQHVETHQKFKCSMCNKEFQLKWRLTKHMRVHDESAKFCHFFNNEKTCPFEEFGCAFKHEVSPECFFKSRCKNKLCQFKHKSVSKNSINVNTLHPLQKHAEVFDDMDENNEETDTEQFRYDSSNVLCEHYCTSWELSGGGHHIDTQEEFFELRGVNVKNISDKYDENTEDFIQIYPCNICEFNSNDLDKLKNHIREKHSNKEFNISCLCNTCDYTTDNPELMHKHIRTLHIKLLKKLVKESK